MKFKLKKTLSLLLAFVMVIGLLPAMSIQAQAADMVTITFDPNGGGWDDGDTTKTYLVESGMTLDDIYCDFQDEIEDPEWAGHQFKYWEWEDGDDYTPITEDITVVAVWSSGYTVTFNPSGGKGYGRSNTNSWTVQVEPGQKVADPGDPTRSGYVFDGWRKNSVSGAKYNFNSTVSSDLNLVAKWIKIYTVTFDPQNGESTTSVQVQSGSKVAAADFPADPVKDGYSFDGWYYLYSDTVWEEDEEGDLVEVTTEEERAFTSSVTISSNTDVYAKWTVSDPVTVTYDANGGDFTGEPSVEILPGNTLTRPADPTREDYTFLGWYNGDTAWNFADPVTAAMTLTAHWQRSFVTVTFDPDNGDSASQQTVSNGGNATRPADPEKNGYVFAGWYNRDTAWTFADPVTDDMTLTAHWVDANATFTVTFNRRYYNLDTGKYAAGGNVYHDGKSNGYDPYIVEVSAGGLVAEKVEWVNASKYFMGWHVDDQSSGTPDASAPAFDPATTPIYSNLILTAWGSQFRPFENYSNPDGLEIKNSYDQTWDDSSAGIITSATEYDALGTTARLRVVAQRSGVLAFQYKFDTTGDSSEGLYYTTDSSLSSTNAWYKAINAKQDRFVEKGTGKHDWDTATIPVSAGDTYYVIFVQRYSGPSESTNTAWLRNFKLIENTSATSTIQVINDTANCTATASAASANNGELVVLTATPDANNPNLKFDRWVYVDTEGNELGEAGRANPLYLAVDGDAIVKAVFTDASTLTLTLGLPEEGLASAKYQTKHAADADYGAWMNIPADGVIDGLLEGDSVRTEYTLAEGYEFGRWDDAPATGSSGHPGEYLNREFTSLTAAICAKTYSFWLKDFRYMPLIDELELPAGIAAVDSQKPYLWTEQADGSFAPGNSGENSSISRLRVTIGDSNGLLSFTYKTSCEPLCDFLYYQVGSELGGSLSTIREATNYANRADYTDVREEWTTVSIPVYANTAVYFGYYKDSSDASDEENDDAVWIKDITFISGTATVTYDTNDAARGTIESNVASGSEASLGYDVTLTATANEGYTFYGWLGVDGNGDPTGLITKANPYTFQLGADTYVRAYFVVDDGVTQENAVARVGDIYFATLENALLVSLGSGDTAVLMKSYTLTESFAIPSGAKLLIPYAVDDEGCFSDKPDIYHADGKGVLSKSPANYVTLTVPEGLCITVQNGGELCVNALMGLHQPYEGVVDASYGCIDLQGENSKIVVNDGGTLYAYGFIKGSGIVEAKSGATTYEFLQMADWGGGSAASNWVSATNDYQHAPEVNTFYFSQYYVQNIEARFKVDAGASAMAVAGLRYNTSSNRQVACRYIGQGGLFQLASGYVLRTYNLGTDRTTYEIHGDLTVGGIQVTISFITLNSNSFILGLNGNMDIVVSEGTTTLNNRYALLPGLTLTVDAGATLNISENAQIYVWNIADWNAGWTTELSGNKKFVYNNTAMTRVWRTSKGVPYARTLGNSASFVINGTLNLYDNIFVTNYTESADTLPSMTGTGVVNNNSASVSPLLLPYTQGNSADSRNLNIVGEYPVIKAFSEIGELHYDAEKNLWTAHTHRYGDPVWTWTEAENGFTAAATFTCEEKDDTQTVEAVVTSKTTAATCAAAGEMAYTATATFEGTEYTEVKTVEIEKLAHTPGEAVRENEVAATCETAGSVDLVVYCSACHAELSRDNHIIPALGHTWGNVEYTWAADNSTVTAKRTCTTDPSHVETETVHTTYAVTTEATCTTTGIGTYTATFINAAFTAKTQTVEIPALGHEYGVPAYVWAEDNSTVTATRVCAHDASHFETETVNTTYAVTVRPTVNAEGTGTYTADFSNSAFALQTKTVSIDKLAGYPITVGKKLGGDDAVITETLTEDYGAIVTRTADEAPEGYTFIGWYNPTGNLLSTNITFSLYVTSKFEMEAWYQKNSGTVTFKSNNRIIETITAESITANDIPGDPGGIDGYTFTGWDKDLATINAELAQGGNVLVTAQFTAANTFTVRIYNGEKNDYTETTYTESQYIQLTAEAVEGKEFAYWTADDVIATYNANHRYWATRTVTLRAVYTETEIEPVGLATITASRYDKANHKAYFTARLIVPTGAKIVKAGLVAASSATFDPNAGVELTADNAEYVKFAAAAVGTSDPVNYTWNKSKVTSGSWYARAYLVYTYNGNEHVIYGDQLVEVKAQ